MLQIFVSSLQHILVLTFQFLRQEKVTLFALVCTKHQDPLTKEAESVWVVIYCHIHLCISMSSQTKTDEKSFPDMPTPRWLCLNLPSSRRLLGHKFLLPAKLCSTFRLLTNITAGSLPEQATTDSAAGHWSWWGLLCSRAPCAAAIWGAK